MIEESETFDEAWEELELEMTGAQFFSLLTCGFGHGLVFRKHYMTVVPGTAGLTLMTYYFEREKELVYACVATSFVGSEETGDFFSTRFIHATGEPSEIGPRFVRAREVDRLFYERLPWPDCQ